MARIPDYDVVGTTVPRTNTPRFGPDRSREIEGQGRAELAATVGGVIQAAEEHDDKLRYAQARSILFQADAAARQQLEQDSDYEKYEAKYTDALGKAREQAGALIRGGRSKQIFQAEAQADFDRNLVQVRGLARGREVEAGVASLSEILEANRNAALEAKDQESRARIFQTNQDAIQGAVQRGYIRPEKGAELGRAFVQDFSAAYIGMQTPAERVRLLSDPAGYGQYIPADKRAAMVQQATRDAAAAQDDAVVNSNAAAILETYERNGVEAGQRALSALTDSDIPTLLRDEIRTKVNAGVGRLRDQRRQENADLLAEVETSISNETAGRATRVNVDRLYELGALTPEERAGRLGNIERLTSQRMDRDIQAQAVQEALQRGERLDPKDKDHRGFVDAAFGSRARALQLQVGSPEWRVLATDFTTKTGILPQAVQSWLRSAALSPDVETAAATGEFLDVISERSPQALEFVDADTKSFGLQVGQLIAAGTPPGEAVKVTRKLVYETSPTERAALETKFKDETKQSGNKLRSMLDDDDAFDPTWLASAPAIPLGMQSDFDALTKRYYTSTGGNMGTARQLAYRDVKLRWGRSVANGDAEIMKSPPEAFGIPGEYVREELLKAYGERAANIRIVPDRDTGRATLDPTGKVRQISYAVVEFDPKTGLLNALPKRYELPRSSAITDDVNKRRAQDIERRRRIAAAHEEAAANYVEDPRMRAIGSPAQQDAAAQRALRR